MPGKPLTALMTWRLHVACARASVSDSRAMRQAALELVVTELGEALTYLLSPHTDEFSEPAKLEEQK